MSRIHGGNVYRLAVRAGVKPEQIIDFSASINPYGPPQSVLDGLKEPLFDIVNYPDPMVRPLVNAIADHYNLSSGNILVGNGSTELIYLLPAALHVGCIVTISPSFSEYAAPAGHLGVGEVVYTLRQPFELDIDDFLDFLNSIALTSLDNSVKTDQKPPPGIERAHLVYLANPNNPTGRTIDPDDIYRLLSGMKHGYLVVDEAFIDFCPEYSVLNIEHPRLIVLRSFTKFYSVPGLRLGFVKCSASLIEMMRTWQPAWSVNAVAAKAGVLLLGDPLFESESRRMVRNNAKLLEDGLNNLDGLFAYPAGKANFILVRSNKVRVQVIAEGLLKRLILVRDCASFGIENHFRVAVKRKRDNLLFLDILKDILCSA